MIISRLDNKQEDGFSQLLNQFLSDDVPYIILENLNEIRTGWFSLKWLQEETNNLLPGASGRVQQEGTLCCPCAKSLPASLKRGEKNSPV